MSCTTGQIKVLLVSCQIKKSFFGINSKFFIKPCSNNFFLQKSKWDMS